MSLPSERSAAMTHFSAESYAFEVPFACPEKSRGTPTAVSGEDSETVDTVDVVDVGASDSSEGTDETVFRVASCDLQRGVWLR